MNEPVYFSVFVQETWTLHIAATKKGLCYVGSPGEGREELARWVQKRYPGAALQQNEAVLAPYREELKAYFTKASRDFTLPVDVQGTPFQTKVWEALQQIPYGETHAYSDIAARIQNPYATRAVGAAIGANPAMIVVPCHRVVGKSGAITGYRGGLELKQFLLELEAGSPRKNTSE